MASKKQYWLMKSEPDCYSIDDLERDGTTCWDGVRNYQARNMMRDDMKVGDGVLFYHSSVSPPGVAGVAEVCREAYPDDTALDPDDDHYDPKATPENPRWMMVDIKFVRKFAEPVPLPELKENPKLKDMVVTQKGSRLSVQPVSKDEWQVVTKLRK